MTPEQERILSLLLADLEPSRASTYRAFVYQVVLQAENAAWEAALLQANYKDGYPCDFPEYATIDDWRKSREERKP